MCSVAAYDSNTLLSEVVAYVPWDSLAALEFRIISASHRLLMLDVRKKK